MWVSTSPAYSILNEYTNKLNLTVLNQIEEYRLITRWKATEIFPKASTGKHFAFRTTEIVLLRCSFFFLLYKQFTTLAKDYAQGTCQQKRSTVSTDLTWIHAQDFNSPTRILCWATGKKKQTQQDQNWSSDCQQVKYCVLQSDPVTSWSDSSTAFSLSCCFLLILNNEWRGMNFTSFCSLGAVRFGEGRTWQCRACSRRSFNWQKPSPTAVCKSS